MADGVKDALHHGRPANHLVGGPGFHDLAAEFDILGLHFALTQGAAYEHLKAVDIHGLGDEIVGPSAHGLDSRVNGTVGGHHNADGRRGALQDLLHEFHAVIRADFKIGDHHIGRVGIQCRHGTCGVSGDIDFVMLLKRRTQTVPRVLLVIDDENCFFDLQDASS